MWSADQLQLLHATDRSPRKASKKDEDDEPASALDEASRSELTAAFNAVDTSGDGKLSRAELILRVRQDAALATKLGLLLPGAATDRAKQIKLGENERAEFERVFQEMDTDDDKCITLDEFVNFFAKRLAGKNEAGGSSGAREIDEATPLALAGAATEHSHSTQSAGPGSGQKQEEEGEEEDTGAMRDETKGVIDFYALGDTDRDTGPSVVEPAVVSHYSYDHISMIRYYTSGKEAGLSDYYGTKVKPSFFGKIFSSLGELLGSSGSRNDASASSSVSASSSTSGKTSMTDAEAMERLEELLEAAVNLKLTNEKAIGITRENVESGRQGCSAQQYVAIWTKRVEEAERYEGRVEMQTEWVPDGCSNVCMQCAVGFWLLRRRHHCRGCGWLLCDDCSSYKQPLSTIITPNFGSAAGEPGKLYRVCRQCKSWGVDMKKTMDILNAGGKISLEQAGEIWERYDEDHSGTLSKEELRHVLSDCLQDQKATLQHAARQAHAEARSEVDQLLLGGAKTPATSDVDTTGGTSSADADDADNARGQPQPDPDPTSLNPALEHMASFASTLALGLVSQCVATIEKQLTPTGLDTLVEETYERMDVDSNGVVTKDEFVVLIGEILSPPGIADACSAFDISTGGGSGGGGNGNSATADSCSLM
jgi:Ca2+-binding EF-hand superfamily protein